MNITFNKDLLVLYKNAKDKVLWLFTILSFSCSILIAYLIFKDYNSFVMGYSSKLTAILSTVLLLILSNIMTFLVVWLSGKYVLLFKKVNENQCLIQTWTILGRTERLVNFADIIKKSQYYRGLYFYMGTPLVNAPWIRLYTKKAKVYVFDIRGEFSNNFFKIINRKKG